MAALARFFPRAILGLALVVLAGAETRSESADLARLRR
jgi:hypothetical protein